MRVTLRSPLPKGIGKDIKVEGQRVIWGGGKVLGGRGGGRVDARLWHSSNHSLQSTCWEAVSPSFADEVPVGVLL